MTDRLTLRILTPVGTAFEGPVEAVFVPGSSGAFEVLPGHAPIISSLESGRILWRHDGREDSLAVRTGAMIVENNTVTVCAQQES
ncbi:MAG: F0F1 ATP synthase subunit epsilon [Bacteroidales bacterium]|nr:F0F1 ATP synthase subunit epsilon [Bacteroidales bacterium]